MSHAYAPRIGAAIGGGLPGLPQRTGFVESDPNGPPVQHVVLRAAGGLQQTFITPSWATRARVTALGRGGQGLGGTNGPPPTGGAHGGGGAGIAATLIEEISPSTGVEIALTAIAATAEFLNYRLSGGNGGNATTSAGGAPGIGAGGAVNFNGGAGETVGGGGIAAGGGGGAAGRGGNGVNGSSTNGGNSGAGDAYASGGGAGGAGYDSTLRYGGQSIVDQCLLGAALIGKSTQPGYRAVPPGTDNANGGDGGGGSGGSQSSAVSNIPGAALILIELW